MTVKELKDLLLSNSNCSLLFHLPSGHTVPAHFHVTEIGQVKKTFIDCGGTRRETTNCVLQLWTADDLDHRLTSMKLLQILGFSTGVLDSDDLQVHVEYGADCVGETVGTYLLGTAIVAFDRLDLFLQNSKTACLALDKCGC